MPERSDKLLRLQEEASQYELPYVSKSRVMQWIKNKEHFRFKYLEEIKPDETEAMRRGTDIHETFEEFYINAAERDSSEAVANPIELLGDYRRWCDYTEPYITNFFQWERRRLYAAKDSGAEWHPVSVEEEHWRDPILGIDGEPEWMGLADVIVDAGSVAEVPDDEGVVIIDFKTGSVPDKKYRSNGIYTELEYYTILFEEKYDVVDAAAYYPRHDELVVQPRGGPYRDNVECAVREMVSAVNEYDGSQKFEANEGPLCMWSEEDGDQSDFYGICSQCTWGVPANNKEAFTQMVEEGYSYKRIANDLGTSTDAVQYWSYKFDLK